TFPIQSSDDVNRNPLRSARAEHRNDMKHSDFAHDPSSQVRTELSMAGMVCESYGIASMSRMYRRTRTIFFRMVPDCAISTPNKNQVGLRISHVNPATPTAHTARHTIQNFRCKSGITPRDSAKTTNSAQNTANPTMPCSTSTDKKVLWAAGIDCIPN